MTGFDGDQVAGTALAVAAGRAVEATRSDALVVDPYAGLLVAAARSSLDLPVQWPDDPTTAPPMQQPLLLASLYIGLRTRFIDDVVGEAGPTRQTVILGAGLDTRAFRLVWPDDHRVFELDHPDVLAFKSRVLTGLGAHPACELVAVGADLAQPWSDALRGAGFDEHQPTAWVVEGLLPYLSAAAQQDALDAIAELSATGSWAVLERAAALPDSADLDAKLRAFSAQTGLAMSDLLARANPPDPAALLGARGWLVREHSVAQLCDRYRRTISLTGEEPSRPAATGRPDHSRGGFVTARLASGDRRTGSDRAVDRADP